jgi:hypothetical protein
MDTHPHASRTTAPAARRTLALLLAVALVGAACGGGDDGDKDVASMDVAPMPMPSPGFAPDVASDGAFAERGAIAGDAGLGGVPGSSAGPVSGRPDDGRAIVRSAFLELLVDDGASAIDAVIATAEAFDGYVASTSLSRADDGTVSGWLTLRVPADRLDEVVETLDDLARAVPLRSVDEQDVTTQLSDLDARIDNLLAFELELRALLTEVRERGGDVEGLVTIADRLREVRTEIDLLEAMRTGLSDQVTMSTVTVSVQQARSTTPVVGTWDLPGVVRDALAATVRLGQLAVEGLVWVALTLVPALVVLVVLIVVGRRIRAARRTG